MGDVKTGSQESGLTNPAMQAAATTIGNQLNSALSGGVKADTTNRVPGLSSQTQNGINSIFSAAGNVGGLNAANDWARGTVNSGGYNDALAGAQNQYQNQINSGGYNAGMSGANDVYRGLANAGGYNSAMSGAQGIYQGMANAGGYNAAMGQAQDVYRGQINSGGYSPALSAAQTGVQTFLNESQADAPGYAAMRAKAGDDTLRDVNAIFTSNGRFGSGSHVGEATESLGNVYANMDQQQYENRLGRQLAGNQALAGIGQTAHGNASAAASGMAGLGQTAFGNLAGAASGIGGLGQTAVGNLAGAASGMGGLGQTAFGNVSGATSGLAGVGQTAMGNAGGAASALPSLYQAGLMPGQAMLGAGQIIDANNAARAQGDARVWDAVNNGNWNTLQRGTAIFGGTAPVSGTQTTESQPWWKVGLGLGTTGLGFL